MSASRLNAAVCLAFLFIYSVLVLPTLKPFAYSDDWHYVQQIGQPFSEIYRWFLAPNADHFIPFMKAMQLGVLLLFDFDFRSVILLNVTVAAAGAIAAFSVAKIYRGRSHWLDALISLAVLNPSFSGFGWGFGAQFVFSVAGLFVVLLLLGRGLLTLALSALLLLALTGANGIVLAAFAALGVCISACIGKRWYPLAGSGAVLLTCIIIVSSWTASEASKSADFLPAATWLYGLSKGAFGLGALTLPVLKFSIFAAVVVSALVAATSRVRARKVDMFESAVLSSFVGTLALLAALTLGRSGNGPFEGLEAHYGYLAIPTLCLGWIIASRIQTTIIKVLGAVLFLANAEGMARGFDWRLRSAEYSGDRYAEIERLIRSDEPIDTVLVYMPELFFIDNESTRAYVTAGIERLRQRP